MSEEKASFWSRFFCDANQFCGIVDSEMRWREVVMIYAAVHSMSADACALWLTAKLCRSPDSEAKYGMARFSFSTYDGEPTLAEWALDHSVDLSVEAVNPIT